jgi:hypothetical protein
MAGLGGMTLFLWWLYEAATLHAVRGHRGLWVSRANEPGAFWFNVGLDFFWAAILTVAMVWVLKRLTQRGEWAKATGLIIRRWR